MKRIFAGLLAAAMSLSLLAGCGQEENTAPAAEDTQQQETVEPGYEEGLTTRIAALKGPTAMGLVCLMDDNQAEDAPYQFDLYTSGDEIVPLIAQGEVDIALIPTNLAATLYQRTEGGVQVLDVNAGNVLYVVSHDETLTDLEGLGGKTVYMTGKGTSPDWTLQYLLEKSGISTDELAIEFKSEATEVVSALAQDSAAVGILPQPFATVAMMQDQEMSLNFPLENAWKEYSPDGSGIATGVTVVRTAFAEEHPAAVAQFVADHQQSVAAAEEDPARAAQLIEQAGIVNASVAQQVIENFNPMTAVSGEEMQAWVSGYLEMLYEIAPDAVGGQLPDEGFYYLG
nr:ABC transporter substrate-binding protein [uncultured Agathobaculum sp.]